jgi:hypothetical protein
MGYTPEKLGAVRRLRQMWSIADGEACNHGPRDSCGAHAARNALDFSCCDRRLRDQTENTWSFTKQIEANR